jgi:decaprenyl-phosphate phosphoribosyltransferase
MPATETTAGAVRPRRGAVHAALVTMRPHQWIKNALVIAAAGAAGALGTDDVPARVAAAAVAFCLLSAGIYAINDVCDAAEDRHHPRKRFRPVAARELDPQMATMLGVTLMVLGLVICVLVRPLLGLVGLAYLGLTLSYTFVWRQILLLDLVAIAGGFVLRAVAGGVAAPVTLSRWFVLVVTCSAIFIAAGKRHAEILRAEHTGRPGRKVLEHYAGGRLNLILTASACCALFAYCVWAFNLPLIHGVPWRPLTIVPFSLCLLRYRVLIERGHGEAPEQLLLTDRRLALAGVAWLVLFALGVHAAS